MPGGESDPSLGPGVDLRMRHGKLLVVPPVFLMRFLRNGQLLLLRLSPQSGQGTSVGNPSGLGTMGCGSLLYVCVNTQGPGHLGAELYLGLIFSCGVLRGDQ